MNIKKESAEIVMLAALVVSNPKSLCLQKRYYLHVLWKLLSVSL